jgi:DNA-binding response OmpR family regulator
MQNNLILLVEDDRRLAQLVKEFLETNGFQIALEENGLQVLAKVKDLNPALVILDLMLPGKDGLSVCKEIRPYFTGPIMMLTARDADIDQVLGLEYGADDYVIKPAEPPVLLARIRALLRRALQQDIALQKQLEFGQLRVLPEARKVILAGDELSLSSHEFDLLEALASQAGQIISREYLFNHIYHRDYDGLDRTIDVRISQLRKRLKDNPDNPTRIKTIWGKGYLFVADAWLSRDASH